MLTEDGIHISVVYNKYDNSGNLKEKGIFVNYNKQELKFNNLLELNEFAVALYDLVFNINKY